MSSHGRLTVWLLIVICLMLAPVVHAQVVASAYTQISSQRVGRTTWNYTYSVQFTNEGMAAFGVTASVVSTTPSTVIVSGNLSIGDLAGGAQITPSTTITVQQDRALPFSFQDLAWTITPTRTVQAITGYSNPLDSRFFAVLFSNGDSLTLAGEKSSDGTPQALRSVVSAQSSRSYQLGYQAAGPLSNATTPEGYAFQFAWLNHSVQSVTVTLPNGQQVTTPLPATGQPSTARSLSDSTLLVTNRAVRSSSLTPTIPSDTSDYSSTCAATLTAVGIACGASAALLAFPTQTCAAISVSLVSIQPELAAAATAINNACLGALAVAKAVCLVGSSISNQSTAENICNSIASVINTITKPTAALGASPARVAVGTSFVLAWSSTWATACGQSGGSSGDGWGGDSALSGIRQVRENVSGTYTYSLICTEDTRSVSATATVTVGTPITLAASTKTTTTYQPFTLTWSAPDASSCSVSGGGPNDGWGGSIATDGSSMLTEANAGTYTYIISCAGPFGSGQAQVTVIIADSAPGLVFHYRGNPLPPEYGSYPTAGPVLVTVTLSQPMPEGFTGRICGYNLSPCDFYTTIASVTVAANGIGQSTGSCYASSAFFRCAGNPTLYFVNGQISAWYFQIYFNDAAGSAYSPGVQSGLCNELISTTSGIIRNTNSDEAFAQQCANGIATTIAAFGAASPSSPGTWTSVN